MNLRSDRKKFKVTFQIPFQSQILEIFNKNLCECFITTTRKRAMNQFRKKYGHDVRVVDIVEMDKSAPVVVYENANLTW